VDVVPTAAPIARSREQRARTIPAVLLSLVTAAIMLSFVAALNGSPLPFPDSRSYWVGGQTAARMAVAVVDRLRRHSSQALPVVSETGDVDKVRDTIKAAAGVRSAFYSLFLYLSEEALSFWGVVFLQALSVAYSVLLLFRVVVPSFSLLDYLAAVAVLCLCTSAPWVSGELMPDVFTGVVIAISIVLFFCGTRLSGIELALVVMLQAFAISTHASHLLVATALFAVGTTLAAWVCTRWTESVVLASRLGAPILLGLAGTLLVSYVGFGKLSLVPQSPPFLLARALQDGPVRLFLQETCPESGFTMCQYLGTVPEANADFVWNFLWAPNSIYMSGGPHVRESLRREEMPLVLAAMKRHPFEQASASASNALLQLIDFGAHDMHWGGSVSVNGEGYGWQQGDRDAVLLDYVTAVDYAAAVGAIFVLAFGLFAKGRMDGDWRRLMIFLVAGVVGNAAVCGVLSEPASRYQARVMWLVVAVALMFVIAGIRDRTAGQTTAGPSCTE
jgi:hypothetical protein